jgi:hypothetical protein
MGPASCVPHGVTDVFPLTPVAYALPLGRHLVKLSCVEVNSSSN